MTTRKVDPPSTEKPDPILDAVASMPGREQVRELPATADALTKGTGDPEYAVSGTPQAGRSTLDDAGRKGPIGYLQLLGPGLITGASDDDPSGIGTYSQVGSQFGYGLLWMAAFTFPLMTAVQELCARIALQTGVGLGVSLRRKFPTWIVAICVLALFVANTINIGADLGAVAAGGELLSRGFLHAAWLVVPAALLIGGLQVFSAYALIFKIFKYLTLALFAYVITVFVAHPQLLTVLKATVFPHVEISGPFITAMVAVFGTTISPYLFFWQASSEVDEMKASGLRTRAERRGTTMAELRAARFDIVVGMALSQIVMYCIILTNAAVLNAHGVTSVQTAQDAAGALQPLAGDFAFVLFAVGLIGTGLLAIPILAGSAAYAVKEVVGLRGNLALKPRHSPTFYGLIVVAILVGVIMNFAHIDPIKALFVTAVINGIVAPPLLLLITLLGSDRRLMGERTSGGLSRLGTWMAFLVMTTAVVALALVTWGSLASS